MRDEFEIELQRPEAGEFDDQLSDEALDRVAAPALATGCTNHCGPVMGPLKRRPQVKPAAKP
jgi:hypothetical protein